MLADRDVRGGSVKYFSSLRDFPLAGSAESALDAQLFSVFAEARNQFRSLY